MPLVARGDSSATVAVDHGNPMPSIPTPCGTPSTQTSDECSQNVFAVGIGVVRLGDKMISHATPACPPHAPPLDTYSQNVYANGRNIGRERDTYAPVGSHVITAANQGTVFANGD